MLVIYMCYTAELWYLHNAVLWHSCIHANDNNNDNNATILLHSRYYYGLSESEIQTKERKHTEFLSPEPYF